MAFGGDWQEGAAAAAEVMNDYKRIRNSGNHYRRLTPKDTRTIHQQSLNLLERFLQTHDPRQTIVMTHHAPSALSLPERRRSQLISCAYASHLDSFVKRHQPALWIHGHIHHSSDYRIGLTRIIANPQGYPEAPNENFDPELLLDL
jgi:Icc-related predicted phosphoesterase